MSEEENELISLSHLIVERLATREQIDRFNLLRKQGAARHSSFRSEENQPAKSESLADPTFP